MFAYMYANADASNVDEQARSCIGFAERHGMTIVHCEGGEHAAERLRELVGDALDGMFDTVIFPGPECLPEADRDAVLSELVCSGVSVIFACNESEDDPFEDPGDIESREIWRMANGNLDGAL